MRVLPLALVAALGCSSNASLAPPVDASPFDAGCPVGFVCTMADGGDASATAAGDAAMDTGADVGQVDTGVDVATAPSDAGVDAGDGAPGDVPCPADAMRTCPVGGVSTLTCILTDTTNCGGCERPCVDDPATDRVGVCASGVCDLVCAPFVPNECTGDGGARCVDLATDPNNCGTCGRVCPGSSAMCLSGVCG